jgi:hypothetical protein
MLAGHTHLGVRAAMNCRLPRVAGALRARIEAGTSALLRIGNHPFFSKRCKRWAEVGAIKLKEA